ncbi:MAG: MFS transporter, partial [Planktomarina sp.]|nr:MFS transporter [Planktomarina sp.]MDS9946812.1 MFS transporter [Planktomarina sp.]|tara:strand:- start:664 stop:1920 length:1257 start_codon:yes stop_codon:yes gene_type:complete
MVQVLSRSWALLLGMMLLMVGNGLQGTLLGVRGGIEGFSTFEMSFVMSAYFAGFLVGSRVAPEMIRRVGHVRVFAALASFVSAILILYPAFANPVAWACGRIAIGFCFSGVYVAAESWLNNSADNSNRGKALSIYMIVQMFGIVSAQALLALGDATGYALFIVSSVLVSISFAPILLSVAPTPAFETAKPMPLRTLIETSPLSCLGMFLLGGVFSAQFGMSAVYGTAAGLSITQISLFVSSIYIGALLMQYPIGLFSDRVDRRLVILVVALLGGLASVVAFLNGEYFGALLMVAFVIGGTSNPLYSLLIAYTNDYLEADDMAAACGGLIFINGVGAISGPLIIGWVMDRYGPESFFVVIAVLMLTMAAYAGFRMTQRTRVGIDDGAYAPVMPNASLVAVEVASEYYIETSLESEINDT